MHVKYSIDFNRYIEQGQIQYIAVTINNVTEILAQSVAINICQQASFQWTHVKTKHDGYLINGF